MLPSRVQVLDRQRRIRIYSGAVRSFCDGILDTLRQRSQTLSVVFVGARRMQELNRNYRGKEYATDVLSFSYGPETIDGKPFLGEIVIAPEIARQQAERYRQNPERELRKLMVHGILHLLGYDHETDRGEMNRLQDRVMRSRAFDGVNKVADMRGNS